MKLKLASLFALLALSACADPHYQSQTSAPYQSAPAVQSTQSSTITIQTDQPGPKINPAMWGAFFEDINFGGDGGLYAELVKNRSFEFPDPLMGWMKISPSLAKGEITISTDSPFRETNPHFVRIASTAYAPLGISNEGFRGMGISSHEYYTFSTQIRLIAGNPKISVQLVAADGTTLASAPLTATSGWSKLTIKLDPKESDSHARLAIFVQGPGTVDLDMVSLFPVHTWKNRPGGLRADMVQALADMHPGFLRFPGGCIVEGTDLARRYQWKNTIGPIEDRKLLVDRWNYEFAHRPTPDYYQSFGLGFFEYFQLCEDIGATPLPLVNCGMACQFNTGELCPPDQLGPYVQDALDLIEFANGPATSTWGAKRAAMGHPEPFNMKMIGIGNEQWGPQYIERLKIFTAAIKKAYPDMLIISAAGPSPDDDRYHYLWPQLASLKADIVDEHCYANPIWFLANSHRFDSYDRNGPKVFFGEYAAQSVAIVSTKNRNNLETALSEAAYMTGLERNADVVRLASYAPLFSNTDAWQWTPDMIWVDSTRTMLTPNYYVQKLYATNRGDAVLPTTNTASIQDILPTGRIGFGTQNATAEFKDAMMHHGGDLMDYKSTLLIPDNTWTGGPTWKIDDSIYRQTDPNGSTTSLTGDPAWNNYTVELKARKLAGTGELVITVLDNAKGSRAQWLLSNNEFTIRTHFAEQDQVISSIPGTLEDNRWYDIRIYVHGDYMGCYLDNKLVQSATVLHHKVPTLFTSATSVLGGGTIILKVINPTNRSNTAAVQLRGTHSFNSRAEAITITGNPTDENTFDHPDAVTPIKSTFQINNTTFPYTFAPNSFTILRMNAQ